jgi:fucose 4-O-acetylase-like acetyltransferase
MNRSVWLDNVRGVAIILVVLGHVIQFGSNDKFDIFTNPVFTVIYAFHMPLFACVSGYVAFASFAKKRPQFIILSRVRSLLLPYAAWTIVGGGLVAFAIQVAHKELHPIVVAQEIAGLFLFPGGSLWFLWFTFLAYIFLAVAVFGRKWLGPAAFPVIVVLVFLIPLDQPLSIYQLKWLFPFFIAGYIARQHRDKLIRAERVATLIGLALFIGLMFLWQRHDSIYIAGTELIDGSVAATVASWTFRYLVAFAGIAAVIGLIRMFSRRWRLSLFGALGMSTLGIYSTQTFPLLLIGVLPSPAGHPLTYFLIYVPSITTIILVITYIATNFVLQRIPLLRLLFLGGRYFVTPTKMNLS